MKELFTNTFKHNIKVYYDKEDEYDDGSIATITISTIDSIERVDTWEYIHNEFEDTKEKYSLDEVVKKIFWYFTTNKHPYVKVEGKVEDNLGTYSYFKEWGTKDSF